MKNYDLPSDIYADGVPWCAVDKDTDIFTLSVGIMPKVSLFAERDVGGDNVECEGMTFWESKKRCSNVRA